MIAARFPEPKIILTAGVLAIVAGCAPPPAETQSAAAAPQAAPMQQRYASAKQVSTNCGAIVCLRLSDILTYD